MSDEELEASNEKTSADSANTIEVITSGPTTRRRGVKSLPIEPLAENIRLFMDKISGILGGTPEQVGSFQFAEFEIHAEITAKGTLAILGSGGEAGATGGLKFVFKRVSPASS